MTAPIDDVMRDILTRNHDRLSPSVDTVVKVHSMLPTSLVLASWTLLPGEIDGQLAMFDDVTVIGWVASLAKKPGWRLERSDRRQGHWLQGSHFQISAVTEVDGVKVKIWALIDADVIAGVPVEMQAAA